MQQIPRTNMVSPLKNKRGKCVDIVGSHPVDFRPAVGRGTLFHEEDIKSLYEWLVKETYERQSVRANIRSMDIFEIERMLREGFHDVLQNNQTPSLASPLLGENASGKNLSLPHNESQVSGSQRDDSQVGTKPEASLSSCKCGHPKDYHNFDAERLRPDLKWYCWANECPCKGFDGGNTK